MIHQTHRRLLSGAFGLILGVATLASSGAVARPATSLAPGPVRLRVMEFNIEYGGTVVSFDSIVRAVRAADADVVGVEEGQGNVPRLAEVLGYPYYNVRLQVVSRLPLIDPPHGDGLYLYVEVAPGRVVALANVHLPPGPYSPNLVRRGATRATILEIERRVRVPAVEPSVTALAGLVARGIPALLLGDFNTPSRLDWTLETVGLRDQIHYPLNWPVSRFVEDAGFHDSYRSAHPDPAANQGLTWPSGRPRPPGAWSPGPNAPADRIDFIYAAGDIQTLGSDLVGESGGPDVTIAVDPWGTDHRAIVSELSVEGGVPPSLLAVGARLVETGIDQTLTFHGPGGQDQHLVVIPVTGDPAYPVADEAIPGEIDGTVAVATDGWAPGTYVALLMDGTSVLSRTRFWIEAPGDGPHVSTSRRVYHVGQAIRVRWWNAPGARWDWIGVYERGADPNVDSYLTWFYTRSTIRGSGTLDADSEGPWPLAPGRYSVFLLADDGYHVLAHHPFVVR
ncbi:MAG: endonuclease/exonuclease/phosphatase family protein [Actinomycetota bacterium]